MATNKEQALIEVVLKGQQANASLKDMEKAVRSLSAQLKSLPKDSQAFADKKAEFQKMSTSFKNLQNDVKGVGGVFQNIGKEIKGFGILAAGYLGFDWLTSSISGIIKNNAQLSDSLADIRKTTGMTEAEARKLNTSFGQINTRTAAKELRNIAIVGGQLGIAKGDIFGFTVAVDKMNVALGDEFTGGAEEVTKAMGGLRNIFTDIKTDKVDQDLLHIGNAINELASSGAATGPVVSDFANRIGGVGITLGLTSGQVLGLSATLQELNVSTERGGTAVTKILQKMTTNTGEFAKVAGIPLKEFTELVNKDLYGAFVKVVEGSKKGNVSATEFGKTLDSLGVDGAGASEVFAKLGSNTKMLGEKVLMANGALKNTDSILAEFNTKNTTLAAEMERLSKGFASAFTNSTVSGGLKTLVGLVADLFDNTKLASEAMADEQNNVNALMIEIKSSNITNERRLEIYDELKAINPEIVDGINRENISIQDLTKNVNLYNAAQINKIAVQKKQEELDEANSIAAEKLIAQSEAATNAYEKLGKIQQLNTISSIQYKKILDDESLTTSEKIKQVYDLARANEWANGKRSKEAMLVKELAGSASMLTFTENEYSKAAAASNIILEEKNKLEKDLIKTKKDEIDYTKLSVDQLNTYVKDAAESMGNYHRKEGRLAAEELKRRELEKKGIVLSVDEETKKKLIDDYKKLLETIKQLEHEQELNKLSSDDKEIQIIRDKYAKLRVQAKGHSNELKRIKSLEQNEIFELIQKQVNKQSEVAAKDLDSQLKRFKKLKEEKDKIENAPGIETNLTPAQKAKKETDDLNRQWDERIEAATNYNLSLKAGEEQFAIDIIALTEAKNAQLEALNLKHTQTIDEQNKDLFKKQISEFEKSFQTGMKIADTLNQAKNQMYEREVNDNNVLADRDIKNQKKLLDAKVISQKEYDKKIQKIEADKEAKNLRIKQKQAKEDKEQAMFKIALNTAIGVSKALADGNVLEAIAIGALGAIEFAVAASTPIPKFAKGGFSNSPEGFTTGSTLYTSSASGKPFIAGEAGTEWIASNWMVNDPTYGPQIQMLEAIQRRGFAAGGNTGPAPQFNAKNSTANSNSSADLSALTSVVLQLNSTLQNLQSNGVPAFINYDIMQKTLSSFDSAKASAQVKS
jgi:TP901 family phage tail tape measure protein